MQIYEAAIQERNQFYAACAGNDVTELKRLITFSQPSTKDLFPSLENAARDGSTEIGRYLLELGVTYDGDLVKAAVETSSIPMLELLRQHGWQCNDNVGRPKAVAALNLACCNNNLELVKYLLELGANPDLGPGGSAILSSAAGMTLWDGRQYNLYHAVKVGSVEMFNLLLAYGAKDMSKACLLNAAVQSRHIENLFISKRH